ncbi:MAG: Homocitrate synthase [Sphingomonas bacterium]|uniref:isocitrate/isopropylmalate dehydrogenase family protein n=1 Tax=Sphingomonas bacterium TaxID=1895847 RepID=UPI00263A2C73|nr:isocitrate/isopropylmalate family dehydrogenase [Sphingomonas bacterium]MDB5696972.1 Homocitrate synthase [Sphingomonas bacterium]
MPTVAVVPGEGAAVEALETTLEVLQSMALGLRFVHPLVGERALAAGLPAFPDMARTAIDDADATLFGATSGPSAAALFYLRWGMQTFANVRPIRWFPGMPSVLADPTGIDLVIVRENLEDAYVAIEGDLAVLEPLALTSRTAGVAPHLMGEGRFALKAITRAKSEQVVRHAFKLARARKLAGGRGLVTASAKHNMLPQTDGLFMEVATQVAADFPDIGFETLIIDDCAHRLVRMPNRFDVLVMPNLYGDILSDMAAGLVGGLGVAASGCFGADYAYFESAHGTAPDIAGKNIVNPTATLLSAAMMLEYLGFGNAAARLRTGIERVYADGLTLTPDVGGKATTHAFGAAVIASL